MRLAVPIGIWSRKEGMFPEREGHTWTSLASGIKLIPMAFTLREPTRISDAKYPFHELSFYLFFLFSLPLCNTICNLPSASPSSSVTPASNRSSMRCPHTHTPRRHLHPLNPSHLPLQVETPVSQLPSTRLVKTFPDTMVRTQCFLQLDIVGGWGCGGVPSSNAIWIW